jgi:diphthine-ammonia ligase
MNEAFVSWSGGKDCCLAAYKARQQGLKLKYLLNTTTGDGSRSCSHGMAAKWIRLQSEALGIPVVQCPTANDNYEAVFIGALNNFVKQGIATGVFGDIDFEPHREWIAKTCGEAKVKPVLPLWGGDQSRIVNEFISLGFQAKVVAVRADILDERWLGRDIDRGFLREIAAMDKGITPCGEAGEFHTLVVDGPIFKRKLVIQEAVKETRGDHWFWDIKRAALASKSEGPGN